MNRLLTKYLLSSVARFPEGEQGAEASADAPAPSDDGQRETLAFDPFKLFAPPAKEGQDGGEGEDSGGGDGPAGEGGAAGAASTAKAPPASPSPDPASAKKEGEEPDPMQALREAVSGFLSKKEPVEEKSAAQPAPAKEPASAEPKQPAPEEVKYEMAVPDEIVEALAADEPKVRKQALNALVNGISNRLARDFGSALAVAAKHIKEEAVQAALGQVDNRTNEQKVRDDFYDNNKDLKELVTNLPALDGVVWQTVQQIASATGAKGWSPQLRDQVAQTLRLQLKLPTVAPVKESPKATPRKASFSAGGGSSSSGRPNGAADQNEFQSVLTAGTG